MASILREKAIDHLIFVIGPSSKQQRHQQDGKIVENNPMLMVIKWHLLFERKPVKNVFQRSDHPVRRNEETKWKNKFENNPMLMVIKSHLLFERKHVITLYW